MGGSGKTEDIGPRKDYYVYALLDDAGNPFYIGYGRGRRVNAHEWQARRPAPYDGQNNEKIRIIRGILKAGRRLKTQKLRERLTKQEAMEVEIALIARIGRRPGGPLVNRTDGGENSLVWDEEMREAARQRQLNMPVSVRQKISVAVTAFNRQPHVIESLRRSHLGKKHSPEARAKMSASRAGVPHSASHVTNQAAAQAGVRKAITPAQQRRIAALRDRTLSDEHRAKISAGLHRFNAGKPKPPPPVKKPKREPTPRPLCAVCGGPVKKTGNKTCSYSCSNKARWEQGIYTSALIARMQAAKASDPDFPRRFKESLRKRISTGRTAAPFGDVVQLRV